MIPDEFTIKEEFLDVGDGHQLYVHDWGDPKAKTPIIFIHGGPGGQAKNKHRSIFEPTAQRVIFFDQRGSGKSLPCGSLEHNTTQDLVADIEKITKHLKLRSFILTGGSWGACLALAFALAHPKRVHAMVLDGIFTGSQEEIDWVDKGRFKTFYPDVWENFLSATPVAHRNDPGTYHFKRILGNDDAAMRESGLAYETMEASILDLDDRYEPDDEAYDPTSARLEIHYLANRCFLPEKYILKNAHTLTMPIRLVQGRYDMVCPPHIAYELHKRLPDSWLTWTISGHRSERESWSIIRTQLLQLSGVM